MDSDLEDYDLEYEEEEEESGSEPDAQQENRYYAAKGLKAEGKFDEAMKAFQQVLDSETSKGDWGFKALKQMVKLTFNKGDYDSMIDHYTKLLTYIKSAVTKNYAEKSINHILDYVSAAKQKDLLKQFYEISLAALSGSNERLWFKTNGKLAKLFLDLKQFDRVEKVVNELRVACRDEKGEDDQSKGTQLVEIYTLEIMLYTELNNHDVLAELYQKATSVQNAIAHPLTMGTIQECGGKVHLRRGDFNKANKDFFDAFKNYDESGSARRIVCLNYLVLSNMLMKSDINPFDSQETKPFRNEPEIVPMTKLVAAYQDNDVKLVEQILEENRAAFETDPFIHEHIRQLLDNVRSEVMLAMIKPYIRMKMSYIAEELAIKQSEVVRLMVGLINKRSECRQLRIDQINGTVVRVGHGQDVMEERLAEAMKSVCSHLESLQKTLVGKSN